MDNDNPDICRNCDRNRVIRRTVKGKIVEMERCSYKEDIKELVSEDWQYGGGKLVTRCGFKIER